MSEQKANDRARAWTINWSNIVSFRVLFGAFVIALVVAILPSMISSAFGGVVFVIVFLVVYGNAIFNPEALSSTARTVGSGSRRGLPPATTAARPSPPRWTLRFDGNRITAYE
jgi:hypothetical protein